MSTIYGIEKDPKVPAAFIMKEQSHDDISTIANSVMLYCSGTESESLRRATSIPAVASKANSISVESSTLLSAPMKMIVGIQKSGQVPTALLPQKGVHWRRETAKLCSQV